MKLCECGCKKPAPISVQTNNERGWIKGQPMRFIKGHANRSRETMQERFERFERFFDKTQNTCWTWKGSKNKKGYGLFSVKHGFLKSAHRFSYELYKGPIPKRKFVCHICDNPSCVNPNHLWVGTCKENAMDMVSKGRHKDQIRKRIDGH